MAWRRFAVVVGLAAGLVACKAAPSVGDLDVGVDAEGGTDAVVSPDADATGTDAVTGTDATDGDAAGTDGVAGTDATDGDATVQPEDVTVGTDALDTTAEVAEPDVTADTATPPDAQLPDATDDDAAQADALADAGTPQDTDAEPDGASADAFVDPCATLLCEDSNPCTEDSCAPASGCVHLAIGGTCSDGNACTFGDVCQTGTCLPGAVTACDDGNVCTADSCDTTSGCMFLPNSATCTDGDACTIGDSCVNQACVGTVASCDDSDPCTVDSCDTTSGCKHVFTANTSPEVCNGVDDNCDGQTDENLGTTTCGTGPCARTVNSCESGVAPACVPGEPQAETCNGIDDDCNGLIDNNPSDTGGACGDNCPGGLVANCAGACTAGTLVCTPGGVKSCVGSTGPSVEVCNNLDDDCDGIVDDNLTDAWKAQACCPTGTVGDCQNSGGGTRCATGSFQCSAGAKVCSGGVAKSTETCNSVDDDCNGTVDDIAQLGNVCTGGGTNTTGACTASYTCSGSPGPGPNGLTCSQGTGPKAETCNGIDDDCNGLIDNNPSDTGGACGENCPGGQVANCVGACTAGTLVCTPGGVKSCVGSTGPSVEVCNNLDDDCDGIVDDNLTDAWKAQACCPTGTVGDCQNSGGGTRCATGSFQCSAGAKVCSGGVAKSTETCNSVDDNCNGSVDDVAQLGNVCTGGGTNTTGACTASYTCGGSPGPGPNGLTCSQGTGPKAETCNGIDDDCNGLIDNNPSDTGGACGENCPGGQVANCVGACTKGTLICASGGTKVCVGSGGPSVEVCNNLDDDCDGIVDDNLTDAWNSQACCATGTLGDCQNSGSGTRCATGAFHCWAGTKVCSGSVAKSTETCNSVDDDCNGSVDDVAQLGNACTGGGTNTTGACTASYTCGGSPGPGPNGLTCSQIVGPKAETCNGIDDNCNGSIDDNPTDVGGACGVNCPGGLVVNCVGACTAGTVTCATGGTKTCVGSIGPSVEICNGVDDDCNGVIDNGVSCDDGNACTLDACKSSGCVNAPSGDGATCGSGKYCVANTCTTLSVPTGMALIPAATFWMGCNGTKDNNCQTDNLPQHKVTLSAYYMDLTETTVAQFKACVDAGICTQPNYVQPANFATYPGLTSNPVNFVSWTQARQYCTWRGTGYDLPTEAQSEMATRGSCEKNGSTASDVGCAWAMRSNPWGETAATCSYAIMWDSSGEGCGTVATWPVGSVTAGDSPYGLHDMAGNVREWNLDWHGPYTSDAQTDPAGPGTGTYRSVRDGSLGEGAINQRSANRSYSSGNPVWDIGLRCARSYP